MEQIEVSKILEIIRQKIKDWHEENESKEQDFTITEDMRQRREMNTHRNDFYEVVSDLISTHTDMWHAEDQIRKNIDNRTVAGVARYITQMNLCRTDLYEELDEIFFEMVLKAKEKK